MDPCLWNVRNDTTQRDVCGAGTGRTGDREGRRTQETVGQTIRLGIDVACKADHQASCADAAEEFLWSGWRFKTTAGPGAAVGQAARGRRGDGGPGADPQCLGATGRLA